VNQNQNKFQKALAFFCAFISELKKLHVWLVRYRVLAVGVVFFSVWLTHDTWTFYKMHFEKMTGFDGNTGVGLFLLTAVGLLKFALDNVAKKHEGHDDN
jgi:hypothetical protein